MAQEAFEAMQQGRAEDAVEILTSIVVANPEDKNALARLVAMYHAVGEMKEIEETLERALDIGAGDEGEFNHLGYSYLRMGNAALAITVFAFNTKAFPESYNAWDSLGEAYMKVGNHEEAVRHYEKSLELNPNNTNALKMLERLRS